MYPILFRVPLPGGGSLPIYSYGAMLGLSLVVGWYLTLGLAEKDGLPRERMANNYIITALVAVVVSRLLYVITNPHEFTSAIDLVSMKKGGVAAYGGFLGGFLASWGYLKWKKMRLLPWADVAVPSLALGLGITRVGCYLFGCDFGKPLKEGAPGWLQTMGTFPHWEAGTAPSGDGSPAWIHHLDSEMIDLAATHSLPVHPTQLYESLVGVGLLVLLLWVRKRQRFRGQVFLVFTFAYGVCRFLIELLRDDPERGTVPPAMSPHVVMPLCLALLAAGYGASFARMVRAPAMRKVSQVLAFAPAVLLFLAFKPESFAHVTPLALSTSQLIGLMSGLAACVAFVVYDKAAVQHPEAAMRLGLPGHAHPQDAASEAPPDSGKEVGPKDAHTDDEEADSEVEDRKGQTSSRTKARKRTKSKKRTKRAKRDGDA